LESYSPPAMLPDAGVAGGGPALRKSSKVLGWVLAAMAGGVALAQSAGGDFAITRQVIAGGGSSAQGGDFGVAATAAQAAAGISSGGEFTVSGGFHVPAPRGDPLFSDGFEGVLP